MLQQQLAEAARVMAAARVAVYRDEK